MKSKFDKKGEYMSRIFKTWRDPYDEGFSTCRKKEIEIKSGVTVLVGCNGAGKSTLLHNIREELKKENIPVFVYDNEKGGGHNSIGESMFYGDIVLGATAMCSSEGENISINLGKVASKLRKFIQTGDNGDRFNKLGRLLSGEDEQEVTSNERWILLDAMDSGYSIDNVIEMKDFFQMVLDDAKMHGMEVYIVISSNEYELAYNSECFDVIEGKYVSFDGYEDFKKFILKTREKKDKRYKRQ